MADYIIPFVTRRGRTLHLHIGGASQQTVLEGCADTFYTEEDNDTDMFKPVRTASGYLRFQDEFDTATWRSMLPDGGTSRPVTLVQMTGQSSWTTLWQGFVQPQTFDCGYPAAFTEHELPVMNRLAALEYFDAVFGGSHNYGSFVSIGRLIQLALSPVGSFSSTYIYFNGAVTLVKAILKTQVRDSFLIDTDTDGRQEARYNCLELLEEICRFFGYTCREVANSIYFTAMDDQDMGQYMCFIQGSDNIPAANPTAVSMAQNDVRLERSMLYGLDHSEEIVQGARSVTIEASVSPDRYVAEVTESELFDHYFDENRTAWEGPVPHAGDAGAGEGVVARINFPAENGSGTLPSYQNDTMLVESYTRNDLGGPNRTWLWIFDEQLDMAAYNWQTVLGIQSAGVGGSDYGPLLRFTTRKALTFTYGVMVISCGTWGMGDIIAGTAHCRLRIGSEGNYRWWNGNGWDTTDNGGFDVYFDEHGIWDTRRFYMAGDKLPAGYCVYTSDFSTPVRGNVMFVIDFVKEYRALPSSERGYVGITDCTITFLPGSIAGAGSPFVAYDDRNENTYKQAAGQFADEVSVDTIFASFNQNTMGDTLLMDDALGYLTTLPYSASNDQRPEEHLLQRMVSFLSRTHDVLHLDVDSQSLWDATGGFLTPKHFVIDPQYRANYLPIAIAQEWRDEVTTLTLMDF